MSPLQTEKKVTDADLTMPFCSRFVLYGAHKAGQSRGRINGMQVGKWLAAQFKGAGITHPQISHGPGSRLRTRQKRWPESCPRIFPPCNGV
jgi:hypothetical protein